jgi:hypothetical protein
MKNTKHFFDSMRESIQFGKIKTEKSVHFVVRNLMLKDWKVWILV